jgi:hypothetical protein
VCVCVRVYREMRILMSICQSCSKPAPPHHHIW